MLLDKILFDKISILGKDLLNKCGLKNEPQNIQDMSIFLKYLKNEIENNESASSILIAKILFSFTSSIEVRDRHVSARIFEDIFCSLFNIPCTDTINRNNPAIPNYIKKYDIFNNPTDDWKISDDLAKNKREKADVIIKSYNISLKTLKGQAFDEKGNRIDNDQNNEINVGSFSYRALLTGIIDISKLKDRKGGLGSGKQVREFVLDPIKNSGNQIEFLNRLKDFFKYVYSEDLYLVLKSHYRIDFILIPCNSFINTIFDLYSKDEQEFEKVFYRWENNNLRLNKTNLLIFMDKYGYKYDRININLSNITNNDILSNFENNISENIERELKKLITF